MKKKYFNGQTSNSVLVWNNQMRFFFPIFLVIWFLKFWWKQLECECCSPDLYT